MEIKERPTVKDILLILGVGAVVLGSVIAPGLPGILYYLTKENKEKEKNLARFDHRLFKQELTRLGKRRAVSFKEVDGKTIAELTDRGSSKLIKYQLEDFKIARPKKWDGKWRLIIFDISDKKRLARDILRDKLKNLGFFQLQKSVFIHPFECRNELQVLRQSLELTTREVMFLVVDEIEEEKFFLKSFNL